MMPLSIMIRLSILICLVIAFSPPEPLAEKHGTVRDKTSAGLRHLTYRGAWFEVRYPAGFIVRESLKSSTADGYDSAEFISQDGSVSFYVYAPQWGGEPTDIAINPEHETLLSEKLYHKHDRKVRMFTINARDGSYQRSYRDTVAHQGSVRTVVGFKYKNKEARLRYQKSYDLFRRLLRQYAD